MSSSESFHCHQHYFLTHSSLAFQCNYSHPPFLSAPPSPTWTLGIRRPVTCGGSAFGLTQFICFFHSDRKKILWEEISANAQKMSIAFCDPRGVAYSFHLLSCITFWFIVNEHSAKSKLSSQKRCYLLWIFFKLRGKESVCQFSRTSFSLYEFFRFLRGNFYDFLNKAIKFLWIKELTRWCSYLYIVGHDETIFSFIFILHRDVQNVPYLYFFLSNRTCIDKWLHTCYNDVLQLP